MLIKNEFDVGQSIDKVWVFFGDIPQVAKCLPGTELSDQVGDDTYVGKVVIRMGPVKMEFAGKATVTERNEAAKRIVVDGAGADSKGRGQAALLLTATLTAVPGGTRVAVTQDLQLSGAAAQYGRGLISDVTSVLMGDFAANMQNRINAVERGLDPDAVASVKAASGLVIALRAAAKALARVFGRFFLPYQPTTA
jgi:carbon monoxide dehydrogenase subunit G